MRKRQSLQNGIGVLALLIGAPAFGQPLPDCTIEFDDRCPDDAPECGAFFVSDGSCAIEGLGDCYTSGQFAYKVTPAWPLAITLSGDLICLRVFFANEGPTTSGTMRFFDAEVSGNEIGTPLETNGDCDDDMPPLQVISFCVPVRRIEVTAVNGTAWIDDFHVNPASLCSDCNGNGLPDACDISNGVSLDCNGNSIPDDCEYPGCGNILAADMNCDGHRDGDDIPRFVSTLVSGGYTCQADMNQDGTVDPVDVAAFVNTLLVSP